MRIHLSPTISTTLTKISSTVKVENYVFEEEPLRRPDFPVAAPPTPVPRVRKISPDIHIHPAGCPDYLLSPPEPQEDGFLIVPARSSRSARTRRQERLPPSPRPLPTPPGPPPSCPTPKITCCPWANSPSASTSTSSLASSDAEDAATRFFIEAAPYLFMNINGSSSKGGESRDPDSPDSSTDAASCDKVPGPQDDTMALNKTQAEAIRDVAADADFLEDIGLSRQAFVALLDGIDIQLGEDCAGRD